MITDKYPWPCRNWTSTTPAAALLVSLSNINLTFAISMHKTSGEISNCSDKINHILTFFSPLKYVFFSFTVLHIVVWVIFWNLWEPTKKVDNSAEWFRIDHKFQWFQYDNGFIFSVTGVYDGCHLAAWM